MLVVLFICIFVVLLGILASIGKLKFGLEFAFFFIIIFSAIRYDYGNDYPTYYRIFQDISSRSDLQSILNDFNNLYDKYEGAEIGWVILNWMFKPLGFWGMIIFTSVLTNVIYYIFIRNYVPRKWYWLALFTYMFDTSLFFVPLSMMRQSFAMVLFVLSFKYIADRRVIPSILFVAIASLFHKSALLLLPFVLLGFLYKASGKIISIVCLFIFAVFMFTKDIAENILTSVLALEVFVGFENYFDRMDAADTFGLGFVSRLLTFFVPFLFYVADKKQIFTNRLITILSSVSFLIIPFTLILGFIGRTSYYFLIFNIAAIPLLYDWMRNKLLRNSLLIVYMTYTLYSFNQFFNDPIWISFTRYQTIFSAPF